MTIREWGFVAVCLLLFGVVIVRVILDETGEGE